MLENEETRRPYIILLVAGMGVFSCPLLPFSTLVRYILVGICMLIVVVCTVLLVMRSDSKLKPLLYGLFFVVAGLLQFSIIRDVPGALF